MLSRAVFLLFCVSFCLAEETTPEIPVASEMSELVLLLTVSACVSAPVLAILLPTVFYYKFYKTRSEVF